VQLYLAGRCTRVTASEGVDAEAGSPGTVTLGVVVDGNTRTTTLVLRGDPSGDIRRRYERFVATLSVRSPSKQVAEPVVGGELAVLDAATSSSGSTQ
jgi:hypothetical protein